MKIMRKCNDGKRAPYRAKGNSVFPAKPASLGDSMLKMPTNPQTHSNPTSHIVQAPERSSLETLQLKAKSGLVQVSKGTSVAMRVEANLVEGNVLCWTLLAIRATATSASPDLLLSGGLRAIDQ